MHRFDEDWRALADPALRTEPLDALKHFPLGPGPSGLIVGGELRARYELYDRLGLGFDGRPRDDYFLGRALLHVDLQLNDSVRAFGQVGAYGGWGERVPLAPAQDNDADLAQAFVDLSSPIAGGRFTLRAGRQELSFGSLRMVGIREGPNTRASFDGVRAFWTEPNGLRVDAFYTRPVIPRFDAFNDRSTGANQLWGAYATWPIAALPGLGLDAYYLGHERSDVRLAQGIADETRHSVGARAFGHRGPWDWDLEAAYQFGSFGRADIRSWTLANEVGYTFGDLPWRPRLGLRADIASGDGDLSDGRVGTFVVPFPKLPYTSEAAWFAPSNIMGLHPTLTLEPQPGLRVGFDYAALWRHREADAFYLSPGVAVPGTAGTGRFIGNQVQVNVSWAATPTLSVQAAYARLFASDSLERAGGRSSDFLVLNTSWKF
ncbi:MAG: alginate export family protein [Rhizobiales bacterium]|nr:alginate export family protein [Rhizobacter sp.]